MAMIETMSAALKLKKIRQDAGVGLREMARRLGVAPSSYAHYEDPNRFKDDYLPIQEAKRFAKALGKDGIGIIDLADIHNKPDAFAWKDTKELHYAITVQHGETAPPDTSLVPVYDIRASAGHGAIVADFESIEYTLAFPPDYLRSITRASPGELAIIGVKGDSMTPTLHDDDIVMVDLSKTNLGYDGLFVLRFEGALHVKRISRSGPGHITVISDNRQNYPPVEYRAGDVEVVGKVIWKGGKV